MIEDSHMLWATESHRKNQRYFQDPKISQEKIYKWLAAHEIQPRRICMVSFFHPLTPLLKLRQGSFANHIGGAQGGQVPKHGVLHHTDGHLAFARELLSQMSASGFMSSFVLKKDADLFLL